MKRKRIIVLNILLILVISLISFTGCFGTVQGDIIDDCYTPNHYPNADLTYDLGSSLLQWENLWVENINGAPYGGGGVHDLLSGIHSDTTPNAVARGDLITGQGILATWDTLPIGAAGTYLYSDGTDISWHAGGGGGGSVNSVTASLPLLSSGGTDPDISLGYDTGTLELNGSNKLAVKSGVFQPAGYYLTSVTGTHLDNVWSSNGILVRTGANTYSVITDNSSNWNTAYGWGNHASAGYLTYETDPVFLSSAAAGISSGNISNWNTAYGWGNHASAGYLTSFTESDPVFVASDAYGIDSTDISNWDDAYGWGDHSGEGYLKAVSGTELDNVWSSNGILVRTGVDTYSVITDNSTTWNAALVNPMTTLGDIIYGGVDGAATRLAGDTSDARTFLMSQSSSGTAQIPDWVTLAKADVGLGNVENTALSTWAGSANITTVGTIGSGTWNGGVISPVYGGTGVANGANNSITFTGNYTLGLTLSNNTSVTLPTSGTLATTANITATKLDDFAAPDDNIDLNATTSAHGLLPKLSGEATEFLSGEGDWAVPYDPSGWTLVKAYSSTPQYDIANETDILVAMDTEVVDTNNEFNTSTYTFTAKEDGVYLVMGAIHFAGIVSEKEYWVKIYHNSTVIQASRTAFYIKYSFTNQISAVLSLSVDDTIKLYGRAKTGGTTVDLWGEASGAYTNLYIVRLR